jgi:hypothetical protein
MLWLPPARLRSAESNLAATPQQTRPGSVVTASATAHTKGAYTTLIAATTARTQLVCIMLSDTSASAIRTDTLVDIAIGAVGAERIILPDLLAGWAAASQWGPRQVVLPLRISAATRISARAQSITVSKGVGVTIWCYQGPNNPILPTFTEADAIGITSAAASIGTSVTPGVGAGVEGAWTNIGGLTTRAYDAILPMIQGSLASTVQTGSGEHWEVGYGGTVLGEYYSGANTSEWTIGLFPPLPLFAPVPAGTQLQIRGETSLATAAQAKDLAIYGLVG